MKNWERLMIHQFCPGDWKRFSKIVRKKGFSDRELTRLKMLCICKLTVQFRLKKLPNYLEPSIICESPQFLFRLKLKTPFPNRILWHFTFMPVRVNPVSPMAEL